MTTPVKILLAGIGGYASLFVNALLDTDRTDVELVGCADPFPDSCPRLAQLRQKSIPVFPDMESFFAAGLSADLCVIGSPIHFHARQIQYALSKGCHVLCEKPLCGDASDIPSLLNARNLAGRHVSIGYQWSCSQAILSLKRDVLDGLFGAPVLLKTLVLWPCKRDYYERGSKWAGRLRAPDGSLILDSIANNAGAHYLHNMLFLLGESMDRSAMPEKLTAVLGRAHPIENYDTASIEMVMSGGTRLLYLGSHASIEAHNPTFRYEFEKAVVEMKPEDKIIRAAFKDGTVKEYGNPFADKERKLWMAVECAKNPSEKPSCPLEAAIPHTRCIALAQEFPIQDFPKERIKETAEGDGIGVSGLYGEFLRAYEDGVMWKMG